MSAEHVGARSDPSRRRFPRQSAIAACALLASIWFSGCIFRRGGPPIKEGRGSVEDIRNRLRGEWELASLTTTANGAAPVHWNVGGQMSYDDFGNWRLHIERHEGAREALLDYSGQGIIDDVRHTIQFEEVQRRADATAGLPPLLGADHPHRYVFARDGTLTTSVLDARGGVIATLVWNRGRVTGGK